jgi:hypothetical protein
MDVAKELLRANITDVEIEYDRLKEGWRTMSPLSNVGNLVVDWFSLAERLNTRMKSNTSFIEFLENFESRWGCKSGVARLYSLRTNASHIQRAKYAYNLYCGNPTVFSTYNYSQYSGFIALQGGVSRSDSRLGWKGSRVFGVWYSALYRY